MAKPWNVNIHYDGNLDACVPVDAVSVLEVGYGDGFWPLACRDAYGVSSLWTSTSRFWSEPSDASPTPR